MPPSQREAFLSSACDADLELRAEVESILACSEEAPDLLEAPAAEAFPELFEAERASALVGTRLGPYRLESLIASGGMGAVYLATRADDQFEKDVAVKLVRRRVVTDETLRRFRLERQTLAHLDHPNIARLLDGGVTSDGLPYLVMEHVDGVPINRFCDENRRSVAGRLRLFRDVCAAVSYAHQSLVVHRDLKPGNILVTAQGVPKLLDFGIAKVLEPGGDGPPADLTGPGRPVMTPEYASPEQVRGEAITTASDVYSLGVVLFELLTGHRPYRIKTRIPHEIERTICEEDPERPSTAVQRIEEDGTTRITPELVSRTREGEPDRLRKRLAGDLDEIILKALRKEPQLRYHSVEQFSADIQRHLDGLPVSARRDTFRYRSATFLRRHRTAVLATAAVAASLVVGIVAAMWQSGRTQAEARKVERVNTFLTSMLGSLDTNVAPGARGTVHLMLDEATESIDSGALEDQPEVEAAVRMTVGMTYLHLGLYDDAESHLATALDIRTRQLDDAHPDVAESLDSLGMLAKATGRYDEAERFYRQALELRSTVLGENSAAYAETANNLGVLLKTTGRLALAEELLRSSLTTRRGILDDRQRNAAANAADLKRFRTNVATTMTNLAAVLKNRGEYARAEPLYLEALEVFRGTLGPDHYRVAVCLNNLAMLLTETGRYEQAEALYREALDIRRKVFGEEHVAVATGLKNLARLLAARGRYDEAELLYREALDLGRRLPGDTYRLANTLNNLAELLTTLGRYDEAELMCREALAIRRKRGEDHPRVAGSLTVLGRIHLGRDDPVGAEPLLRRAVELARKTPAASAQIARAQTFLGACLVGLGLFEEAERMLLDSVELIDGGRVVDPALERETRAGLVRLYGAWGRPDEAARYLDTEDES